MRHTEYAAVFLVVLISCSAVHGQQSTMSAAAIVQRMIRTYEGATSYQDTGVVRILRDQPLVGDLNKYSHHAEPLTEKVDTSVSFKTYYVRPNKFRFEWVKLSQASPRESVVWLDGKRAYRWMPQVSDESSFEFVDSASLQFNIDWALKPSMGSIFFVPTLLMKDIAILPFSDELDSATETTIAGEQEVDGEICYVIKADLSGVPWVLWIGKQSYLLRKIRTSYSTGSFHERLRGNRTPSMVGEEVHSNIKINQRIPTSVFRYRPPQAKRKRGSKN